MLLNDRLKQSLHQSRRYKQQGALLFIDLDGFKAVNDTHGHEAGDQVLQEVAVRLKRCLRESDTAARIGGDEFVVLVPVEESLEGVKILALKLIDVISGPILGLRNLSSDFSGPQFQFFFPTVFKRALQVRYRQQQGL